jgi:hypothetical protein
MWYKSKIASANALAEGISSAGKSIAGGINQYHQDKTANQIGSQMANSGAYAPRAALVSPGTNPITNAINAIPPGLNTQGSAPAQFTGGAQGLQMQLDVGNLQNRQQRLQQELQGGAPIDQALKQAQIGNYNSSSRYHNYLATNPEMQRQQWRRADIDAQKNMDSPTKMANEIDHLYGTGSTGTIINAINTTGGANGRIENGNWVGDPNGPLWSASPHVQNYTGNVTEEQAKPYFPNTVLDAYKQRLQNMPKPGGGATPGTASPLPTGNVGAPPPAAGGQGAPVRINSQAEFEQLAPDTPFIGPDGKPRRKPLVGGALQ